MKRYLVGAALLCLAAPLALAAPGDWAIGYRKAPIGPVKTDRYHTVMVKFGRQNGLLYVPEVPGPNARVGIVYASNVALFNFTPAAELASRGYRVLLVKHYLSDWRNARQTSVDGFEDTNGGITYMRGVPGVDHVVLMGHDVGGNMVAFYAAAAEQGAAICADPELLLPCQQGAVGKLAKPDGVILLDPDLGALHAASAVDPAMLGEARSKHDVDMYAAENGFNPKTGVGQYSAAFEKRFFAAQGARNQKIVDDAAAALKAVKTGNANFSDDEPLTVPGAANSGPQTRLYDTDLKLLSHTKAPHDLLKADGSKANVVVRSVRAATPQKNVGAMATCCNAVRYTVRRFLGNDAVRTTPDFAITADDIVGVNWKSSNTSTPANAEHITVPTLVVANSCSVFVVPTEIVYDHLAAKDKSYMAVEGADHDFAPCKSSYGDTVKRTFDVLDGWLAQPGRF
jgi:hypothetical protein